MGFFKDSLKKWFYTNSSSAASSDARIPLLTATGDPKGSDTMANLASVLGVQYKTLSSSDNLDNLGYGWYYLGGGETPPDNSPFGNNEAFSLYCTPNGTDRVLQIAIRNNKMKYRIRWGSWQSWVEVSTDVPLFYKNYATLDNLVTAIDYNAEVLYKASNDGANSTYLKFTIDSAYNGITLAIQTQYVLGPAFVCLDIAQEGGSAVCKISTNNNNISSRCKFYVDSTNKYVYLESRGATAYTRVLARTNGTHMDVVTSLPSGLTEVTPTVV